MQTYHLGKLEKDMEWLEIQIRCALVSDDIWQIKRYLTGISNTFGFDISDLEGLYE